MSPIKQYPASFLTCNNHLDCSNPNVLIKLISLAMIDHRLGRSTGLAERIKLRKDKKLRQSKKNALLSMVQMYS